MNALSQTGRLHIVIASGEVMANLIPLVHASRRGEVEEVWVLVSDQMQNDSAKDHLVSAIKKFCEVKVVTKRGLDDSDPEKIDRYAKDLSREIATETNFTKIAYHATGGKKLHSLIFARTFEFEADLDAKILYSDGATGTLIDIASLPKEGVEKIGDVLSMETYLFAQGYNISSVDSSNQEWIDLYKRRKPFTDLFFTSITTSSTNQSNKISIGDLNRAFSTESPALPRNPTYISKEALPLVQSPKFKAAFSHVTAEIAGDSAQSVSLSGLTIEDLKYLSGRWFEELVYSWLVKELTPLGAKVSCGVHIQPIERSSHAENELDIVVYSNNNLAVIECKTSSFKSATGNQTAYKTNDITKRITGSQTKAVIASLQPIDEDTKQFRFDKRVAIYDGTNLKSLTAEMAEWVKQTLR